MLELAVRLDRPFHELKESLLAEFERAYLVRILSEAAMNLSMASRVSGLSRKHIRTLMAKHGMRRTEQAQDAGDAMEQTPEPTGDPDSDDAVAH